MNWGGSENDSSDDDEQQNNNKIANLLIAIDCDERMFEGPSPTFKAVLRTCFSLMDAQLFKGGKRGGNRIAIVIMNEDKEKMTVCDFKDHLPTTLKKLQALCEKSDEELKAIYRRGSPMNFGSFLLEMKMKFKAAVQESLKYLAYVTSDDDPVQGKDDLKFEAVNQAKTLSDFGIKFQLLTFRPDFGYDLFFKEVIYSSKSRFQYEYLTDMLALEDKLVSWLNSKGKRLRFFLYPNSDKFFTVIQKKYVKQAKILNNVKVKRDTLEEVIQLKKNKPPVDSYTLKVVVDEFTFNGKEQSAFLKNQAPLGYVLIGTTKGLHKPGLQTTNPKFLQEDKAVESPYFPLLWKYCLQRGKKLLCTAKYKADAAPELLELSPTLINNVKSFFMVGIPFYNDIRYQDLHNCDFKEETLDDENVMGAAENLVQALDFPFDPLKIHDSATLKKFEYIRSELLQEPLREVEEILDFNPVCGEQVDSAVNQFAGLLVPDGKRKAAGSGSSQKTQKRTKS